MKRKTIKRTKARVETAPANGKHPAPASPAVAVHTSTRAPAGTKLIQAWPPRGAVVAHGRDTTVAPHAVKPDGKPQKLPPLAYVELPASAIRAALLCAGKDDVRQNINTVHLAQRDGEAEIVATNGHVLLIVGLGKIASAPAWIKDGATFEREILDHAVRLQKDGFLRFAWAPGHITYTIATMPEWATLKGRIHEGKFPDYAQLLAQGGAALDGHQGVPLTVAGFNPAYVKVASAVAAQLGGKSLHVFQNSDHNASVITFGAEVRAALYIMPISGEAVSAGTAKLLSPALARSAAAIRAHITRAATAAKTTDEKIKKEAGARIKQLEQRLALVLQATGKQIEDKTEATAKAAH